jgi:hypothetical protein
MPQEGAGNRQSKPLKGNKMIFATRKKLNQMTDAALNSRERTFEAIKKVGETLPTGAIGCAILCGAVALLASAPKLMVAVAFGAGAAVPVVTAIVLVIFAGVELDRVESVKASRPQPAARKRAPRAKSEPAPAPAVTNTSDLSDAFHAGVEAKVSTMKPIRLKRQPDQTRVM